MPLQTLTVDLVPVPATTATSIALNLPQGRLVGVYPLKVGTGATQGSLFAQAIVLDNSQVVSASTSTVVWAGPVPNGVAASVPNLPVDQGMTIVLQVVASGGAPTTQRVRLNVVVMVGADVRDAPQGQGFIYNKEPGSGPPLRRIINLANPAAGADFANTTPESFTGWRVAGAAGLFTSAVAVATRFPSFGMLNAAGNNNVLQPVGTGFGASTIANVAWGAGLQLAGSPSTTAAASNLSAPAYNALVRAADSLIFSTFAIQAADTWTFGVLYLDEWAYP